MSQACRGRPAWARPAGTVPAAPAHRMGHHGGVPTTDVDRASARVGGPGEHRALGVGVLRGLPGPDSIWWLVIVAAAFIAAELAFVPAHSGLGWDEVVYVSQVSRHAAASQFVSARARGVSLLVAPVTLLTSSIVVLRVYLSVVSGLALFGALLVWRRFRPAWVLALAGLALGSLWIVQYYGPRAMPNLWFALSGLAAVGFFLRAAAKLGPDDPGQGRAWAVLTGLAAWLAFAALMRPGDAAFLAVPLVGAALVVRPWRRWRLVVATVTGPLAGASEWLIEAFVRSGGAFSALHSAAGEQGSFGLHLGVWAELRALNGPVICRRNCTVGWEHPQLSVWWLALPVLVALGLAAARRAGRLQSAALAAICALSAALQYLFLINYAAPRFLIPVYTLLAVPVADGLAWLVTGVRAELRLVTGALVAACLVLQVVSQHEVLMQQATAPGNGYGRAAADLHRLGVDPPCLVKGTQYIPIAFYAGCASAPSLAASAPAVRIAVLGRPGAPPPAYAQGWHGYRLAGTRLVAYLPHAR